MTKSPGKNVLDVGIELWAACMPSGHASDRATVPGESHSVVSYKAHTKLSLLPFHELKGNKYGNSSSRCSLNSLSVLQEKSCP